MKDEDLVWHLLDFIYDLFNWSLFHLMSIETCDRTELTSMRTPSGGLNATRKRHMFNQIPSDWWDIFHIHTFFRVIELLQFSLFKILNGLWPTDISFTNNNRVSMLNCLIGSAEG